LKENRAAERKGCKGERLRVTLRFIATLHQQREQESCPQALYI
jgi:hypothetical protein